MSTLIVNVLITSEKTIVLGEVPLRKLSGKRMMRNGTTDTVCH